MTQPLEFTRIIAGECLRALGSIDGSPSGEFANPAAVFYSRGAYTVVENTPRIPIRLYPPYPLGQLGEANKK